MNIHALLARYGSPAYVYNLVEVHKAYAALRKALPEQSNLYYSLKANPHPAIVTELRKLGCRAEVSSVGELKTALASDCLPERCLYTGPGKTQQEILFALQQGVTWFSVDSPADLQKVASCVDSVGTQANVLLRVNPDISVGGAGLIMTGAPSQFGADADWIRQQPEAFVGTDRTQIAGFHIYMGTNIATTATLLQTFQVASQTAADLTEVLHIEPQIIDLGGGFGHPFARSDERPDFSDLRTPLEDALDNHFSAWRDRKPQIAFETGRYVTASAGTLFCTVQDIKQSRSNTFVVLDSGIHHLGGMAGLKRVPRIGAEFFPVNTPDTTTTLPDASIVGPLCTPLDHLAHGVDLPSLCIGDIVAIRNVGAYGLTGSLLGFLSRETPVEIVLDGEEFKEASQLTLIRSLK